MKFNLCLLYVYPAHRCEPNTILTLCRAKLTFIDIFSHLINLPFWLAFFLMYNFDSMGKMVKANPDLHKSPLLATNSVELGVAVSRFRDYSSFSISLQVLEIQSIHNIIYIHINLYISYFDILYLDI